MRRSEDIKELAAALAKAQGEIKEAPKDSTNPHFGNAYADLAAVWEVCRTPLSKNGLSVLQFPSTTEEGLLQVSTILLHSSGQFIEEDLVMSPRDKTPQAFGSALTYARRYALMAVVGVAPGDDDGNAGSLPEKTSKPKEPTKPQPPAPTLTGLSIEERDHVINLAKQKGWTTQQVIEHMAKAFGKQKVLELTKPQYQELLVAISTTQPGQTMGGM